MDPFSLLGLPRRYDLDRSVIDAAYLRAVSALHPDRIADPVERAEAAGRAAEVNDARALLVDDEQRANALLGLLGGPGREEDKSLPDGFLMEIMEVRQELEAAIASADDAERERFERWADDERVRYRAEVTERFAAAASDPDPAVLAAIRTRLNAWRYIERMIESLP
jgi:molecular chaperone HscB